MMDAGVFSQLKKGQGETNARLDTLIAEQQTTSALLARIAAALERQAPPPPLYQADTPFTRTSNYP